jgi:hypothetical protein
MDSTQLKEYMKQQAQAKREYKQKKRDLNKVMKMMDKMPSIITNDMLKQFTQIEGVDACKDFINLINNLPSEFNIMIGPDYMQDD